MTEDIITDRRKIGRALMNVEEGDELYVETPREKINREVNRIDDRGLSKNVFIGEPDEVFAMIHVEDYGRERYTIRLQELTDNEDHPWEVMGDVVGLKVFE